MRVALVVPGGFERPERDGPARSVPALNWLAAELAREHEVQVFCTDFDARGGSWSTHGVAVLDPGRAPASRVPGLRTLERTRRLYGAMSRARYDLVHAFWLDGNGLAASAVARALRLPLVASVGGGECVWLPEIGYGNARGARARATMGLLLGQARVVTVGSEKARESVPRARVEVVPLGASRPLFEGEVARAPGPPWRLAAVGHHNAVKDPWTLLAAVRALVARGLDVRLDWLGTDTLGGAVQARAAAWGLRDRVAFHGQCGPERVSAVLREAHLHVLSSRYESQCVAVLEAALAGVPTVGTRVGLLAQLDPAMARAVPVGDGEALANAVSALLGDRREREELALAAKRWALAHDAAWSARRFGELYRVACGATRRRRCP